MNKQHTSIIILAILLLVICFPIMFNVNIADAMAMSFGGRVTSVQPCNNGLLLFVLVPLRGILPFLWTTGNLPYLTHVVPHPAQEMLGRALMAPVPCTLGTTVVGTGFPIIYHGSGI